MAREQFAWWKDASFTGRVARKEARLRKTGEAVDSATALRDPGQCRFFLQVETEDGLREQEVILRVFQAVEAGWRIIKPPGTYECRLTPPEERVEWRGNPRPVTDPLRDFQIFVAKGRASC